MRASQCVKASSTPWKSGGAVLDANVPAHYVKSTRCPRALVLIVVLAPGLYLAVLARTGNRALKDTLNSIPWVRLFCFSSETRCFKSLLKRFAM